MTRTSYRRLRTPVFALVFGSMISTGIGIGQSWVGAAIAYALTAITAMLFYLVGWGESASDTSAVIGGRPDERQQTVRLRAAQAGLVTAIVAVGIACLVSAVERATFWPYEVIIDVVAAAYLISLRVYGMTLPDEECPEPSDE